MSKKLITPVASGGIPIFNEDLLMIQNEAHGALAALCAGIDTAFVISGCDVTSMNAQSIQISPGYLFLDNQVLKFDGYTGAFPVHIQASTPTKEQRVFKDGFSKDAIATVKAVATTSIGSGDYITFNKDTSRRLKAILNNVLDSKINQEITDRTTADTTLQSAIDSKAAKEYETWKNMTFAEAGNFSHDVNSTRQQAQYMKDGFGFVHLRGSIFTNGQGTFLWNPPVGYRPSKDVLIRATMNDATTQHSCRLFFTGTTCAYGSSNTSTHYFSLDGISYYVGL